MYKFNEIQKEEGIIFFEFKTFLGKVQIRFDYLSGKHKWYPTIKNLNQYLIADNFDSAGIINYKKIIKLLNSNPYNRKILFQNINNKRLLIYLKKNGEYYEI